MAEVKTQSAHRKSALGKVQEGILAFVQRSDAVSAIQSFADNTSIPIIGLNKGGIRQAVRYLAEKSSPSFLIVDIADKRDVTRELLELADVCDPSVTVVVLGDTQDITLYRELINLGIKDYIVHPLATESLYDAFDERSGGQKVNKVVAFIGTSGGCGSTTLATTCAWMLAEESKYYTALVDFDILYGSVAHMLNRQLSEGMSDALEHPDRVDKIFVDRSMDAVSDRLAVLSGSVPSQNFSGLTLRGYNELVRRLGARFRYAVMEIPRWNHLAVRAAVDCAQTIVITFTPDVISLRNAVESLHHLVVTYKTRARIIVVMNKAGQYKYGEVTPSQFSDITGHQVDHIIRFDHAALDSINKGGIFTNRGSSLYASAHRLTQDVGGRHVRRQGGLLGGVLGRLTS